MQATGTFISSSRQQVALDWLDQGRRVVAASVIATLGSAPLDPGAEMLVDDTGRIEGSVTGGCVEGALVEVAQEILDGGAPRVVQYGISDALAADVGLMCGGTVRLFVAELPAQAVEPLQAVVEALEAHAPVALATVLDGELSGKKVAVASERVVGQLGLEQLDQSVKRDA